MYFLITPLTLPSLVFYKRPWFCTDTEKLSWDHLINLQHAKERARKLNVYSEMSLKWL